MASTKNDEALAQVVYASHFAQDLKLIEAFWIENKYPEGYSRLLEELADVVIPNLQRHPSIGRHFMKRSVDSVGAERFVGRIASRLSTLDPSAHVLEYAIDDYLVLYLVAEKSANEPSVVHLLALKHQQQLGFG